VIDPWFSLFHNGIQKAVLRKYFGTANEHTFYEADVVGMGLGVELIQREIANGRASIAVNSKAAIQATQATAARPGAYLIDLLHGTALRLQTSHPELHLTIRWVPGHSGMTRNEAADGEAKKAARKDESSRQDLPGWARRAFPMSKSATLQTFNADQKDRSRHLFTRSPRSVKLQCIDPSAPSHGFQKLITQLPRKHASVLIQLRTGHAPLNRHLHKIGKVTSALCLACGEREEMVHHFLFICYAHNSHRHILRQTVAVEDLKRMSY
jgi:hypothetical protein